jgi:hypothetical protein
MTILCIASSPFHRERHIETRRPNVEDGQRLDDDAIRVAGTGEGDSETR